jgi:hypothetical protein
VPLKHRVKEIASRCREDMAQGPCQHALTSEAAASVCYSNKVSCKPYSVFRAIHTYPDCMISVNSTHSSVRRAAGYPYGPKPSATVRSQATYSVVTDGDRTFKLIVDSYRHR